MGPRAVVAPAWAENGAVDEGTGDTRDRDSEGRARNARPRDAYGRPLPRDADAGVPTVSDEQAAALAADPERALAEAQRLLDADRPFHAHEVLEAVWKSAPDEERDLWRGLAQVAVGLTHVRRGNPTGAEALLTRAADRLSAYMTTTTGPHQYGLNLPEIIRQTRTLTANLKSTQRPPDATTIHLLATPG